jgi:hypothetical protein
MAGYRVNLTFMVLLALVLVLLKVQVLIAASELVGDVGGLRHSYFLEHYSKALLYAEIAGNSTIFVPYFRYYVLQNRHICGQS